MSFYLQAHKLVFAVYHLTQSGGTVKFETLQSESAVTWLNEVLALLSIALHRVQQLRDKVTRRRKWNLSDGCQRRHLILVSAIADHGLRSVSGAESGSHAHPNGARSLKSPPPPFPRRWMFIPVGNRKKKEMMMMIMMMMMVRSKMFHC